MDRIVLIGGSLASVQAIEALRGNGYDREIVLIGAEAQLPYDRPPLSKEALRSGGRLSLLRGPDWYTELGVRLELGRAARELRPEVRTVVLEDGHEISYGGLVIATGSQARRLGTATDLECYLRTVEDAEALRERLGGVEHVAIIGAGFVGLEVAATVAELGLRATVIEVAPVPLARVLGDEVGAWFQRLHESRGVRMMCGALAVGVEQTGRGCRVSVAGSEPVHADVIVGAIGARPAVEWLLSSGIKIGDGVLCDSALRTTAPNVVAAGDVARWYNPLFDEDMRVEQWTNAAEQGRHAALTLLGARDAYASIPYFWSDQFSAKMRFVGRANAADEVRVEVETSEKLVAAFTRQGAKIGALCVNAPKELARHRADILSQANTSGAGWLASTAASEFLDSAPDGDVGSFSPVTRRP